ncbi:MAG: prolyl oligopeptidase family serine peptidase [bacterium]|jgi:dienelactone hydrolase
MKKSVYRIPSEEIVAILDQKQTPAASLSPDRSALLLADYELYPSIELLARPFLRLAGIRVDPALSATQRTIRYTGLSIMEIDTGASQTVTGLPENVSISFPSWSPDGRRFAFTCDTDQGVTLWIGERDTATCRRIPDVYVTDILAGPLLWRDDNRSLWIMQIPTQRGRAPQAERIPAGPVIQETEGKSTRDATYQDLLQNAHDEALFVYYASSQLSVVDLDTDVVSPIGEPGLFLAIRPSPNEKHLLVIRLHPPFSYRVQYSDFARTQEIWDAETGATVHLIADLPVADEVPPQGVPTGPRNIQWQQKKDATLFWAEALDGGDPLAKVSHRDKLLRLSAPFDSPPQEVTRVTHRFSGWDWCDREDEVLLTEYDRDRRWRTTYHLNLTDPEGTRKVLFDLSINDAYNAPGSPVYQMQPDGHRTMIQDGDSIYLAGRGATPQGDRPFLDTLNLLTGTKERLFVCAEDCYESFIAFVGNDRSRLLTSYQTRTQPANYFIRDLTSGDRKALTHFPDPHPQITGLKKEIVRYARSGDGVPLSGALYLPPGYQPESDGPLPLIMWSYPLEYSDAATAGQIRGSENTFTRLAGTSPLWFVTQGYAVLDDATMPVVGDPETMNDTFVEQIVGAAKAAIDELAQRGVIDPNRVLVGGHSYGAFMTANLLAHAPGMFAAGIARSGAYNRTLTPFGFQSERRSFWEATDIYIKLSPFTYTNQIKEPILLIHGQEDNNPGTFTMQSERFFQALQANGATARLVLLPHESHGYRSRQSVLHTLAEMIDWANKYVKNKS